jgi:hypothetical protein
MKIKNYHMVLFTIATLALGQVVFYLTSIGAI